MSLRWLGYSIKSNQPINSYQISHLAGEYNEIQLEPDDD